MRTKVIVLLSAATLALVSAPALAQTAPEPAVDPAAAQTTPGTPGVVGEQTVDPVADAGPGADEEIVVTGLRRSLQSAQAIKRTSPQIVDALVAEDIGKLPDINVSESLARLPGLTVERASGEAGDVQLRGLRDFTTTYNGREIFTAEVRRVSPQDFASQTAASLEAFKTTTSNQVEGGIAGLINVRSRKPFDFTERQLAGAVNGTYGDQADRIDFNGNILFSDRFETGAGEFGILLNASYTRFNYLDSARFNGGFIAGAFPDPAVPGTFRFGPPNGGQPIGFPDAVGIFYGRGERVRPTGNVAIQWRPTPELEIYVDGLYQGFRRDVADRRLFVPLFGNPTFSNVALVADGGPGQVQSLTVTGAVPPFLFQGATKEQTDTYQGGGGAIYENDDIKLEVDLARTVTRFDQQVLSFDSAFTRYPTTDINFDTDRGKDGGVEFDFREFDTEDAANYTFGGLFDRHLVAKGDDWQFRTDLTIKTGLDWLPRLQFGGRIVERNSAFDLGQDFRGPPGPTTLAGAGIDLAVIPGGFRGDAQDVRRWISPRSRAIRDNQVTLRQLVGFANPEETRPDNLNDRFRIEERAWGGYAQVGYELTLGGLTMDGTAGVRAVVTDTTNLFLQEGEDPESAVTRSYTDVLPNVNARIEFAEGLQLRGSYTQTRTRPDFNSLRPTDNGRIEGNIRFVRGGNPELTPLLSDNYDLSLEWYFAQTSFASVALFRRDTEGFIFDITTRRIAPVGDALNLPGDPGNPGGLPIVVETTLPINGGAGRIQGIEAQFTTFFDFAFLPELARGFGVQANYTYLDDDQVFPVNVTPSGEPFEAGFLNLSNHTFNVALLYEKGPLNARLAYNRRSEYQTNYDNPTRGSFTGEYTDPTSRLDFSMSYTLFENLTIAADVSNILAEPFRNFREYDEDGSTFPRDVRYEERVFSVGLRFRL